MIVGIVSLAILIISPVIFKKIPGSLIAVIVGILMVKFLPLKVSTIGNLYTISNSLPAFHLPAVNLHIIENALPNAFTIAVLAAIESLLSCVVADGMINGKHRSDMELVAQGAGNIASALFGGIPATGAIARTAANIKNGGRTPVAGVVHAVVLLLIFLFLMPLINLVPMACLAGVLIMVSYNMSGWRTVKAILKTPKSDVTVMIVTFLLTVVFDLTIAIELGLLLAILLFLRRVMENTEIHHFGEQIDIAEGQEVNTHEILNLEQGVEVYEIDGPFFFGVATKFDDMMRSMGDKPLVRILRMRKVPFIDSTAIHNLEILIKSSQKEGIHVVLSGVRDNVHLALEKARVEALVGKDHVCDHITKAVAVANRLAVAIREKEIATEGED